MKENLKIIAKLRSNSVNWVLARYSKKDTIQFIGSGNGDASELSGSLNNDFIEFGLLRVVDVVDKSSTVKYAYVEWIGPNCAAMLRGYFNSKKAEILKLFEPYTLKLDVSNPAELTQEAVEHKIKTLSGTKSSVVQKKEEKKE